MTISGKRDSGVVPSLPGNFSYWIGPELDGSPLTVVKHRECDGDGLRWEQRSASC
ncbi:MAG: hypothetical protein AB7V46_17365 [Thermomicrobiales bacterium]